MAYSLKDLTIDLKSILEKKGIDEGYEQMCYFVKKALMDQNFTLINLKDRKQGEKEREILFEDKDLGFCICGHVYNNEANGLPHDHGTSWAIYGQASGETEMTEWEIIDNDPKTNEKLVKPYNYYLMKAGDVRFYNVGVIHSPIRKEPVKLLRIEGKNLDFVERSKIRVF